jgi:hypothetical protein
MLAGLPIGRHGQSSAGTTLQIGSAHRRDNTDITGEQGPPAGSAAEALGNLGRVPRGAPSP